MTTKSRIIIGYNANYSLHNRLFDAMHKILSPKTYPCNLCELTHGSIKERNEWSEFRKNYKLDVKVWYKNKIEKFHTAEDIELPAVLLEDQTGLISVLISSEEIKRMRVVKELIDEIIKRTL